MIRIVAAVIALVLVTPALAADMAPHKATYGVRSGDFRAGGQIEAISGTLAMVQELTCEAWVGEQDFKTTYFTADGGEIRQRARFSFMETLDGTRYRFAMIDSGVEEVFELRGHARLRGPGESGTVAFSKPEAAEFPLPAGTQFPTAFSDWMIERASQGARIDETSLFDGNEMRGAHKASAFFGRKLSAKAWRARVPEAPEHALLERPGWVIELAYYDEGEMEPFLQLQVLMLDNGIAPEWNLDYGDFRLRMYLMEVGDVPAPAC